MATKRATIQTNISRVRQSVTDTQGRYMLRTRDLARSMGAEAVKNVRDNIRAISSGGVFPGYAITGGLAKKVVASEPEQTRRGMAVTVRVLLTGRQARYAIIHETGGSIPIKNPAQIRAMFANLRKHGQLGRGSSRQAGGPLQAIRIKRKRYFAKGIAKTRREWTHWQSWRLWE